MLGTIFSEEALEYWFYVLMLNKFLQLKKKSCKTDRRHERFWLMGYFDTQNIGQQICRSKTVLEILNWRQNLTYSDWKLSLILEYAIKCKGNIGIHLQQLRRYMFLKPGSWIDQIQSNYFWSVLTTIYKIVVWNHKIQKVAVCLMFCRKKIQPLPVLQNLYSQKQSTCSKW